MKKREVYAARKLQRETRRIVLTMLVVFAIIAFVACIALIPRSTEKDGHNITITNTNVHPGITPVLIYRGEEGVVPTRSFTGGILTDGSNSFSILTCAHPFWNLTAGRKPMHYYYQVIQPYNQTLYPIASTMPITKVGPGKLNPSKDVLLCIPGPSTLIAPVDNPEEGNGYRDLTVRFSKADKVAICYSTVTGQKVECLGAAMLEDGTSLSLLDYPGVEGESGTLFVEQGDHPTIYILSRNIPVSGVVAKTFGIPLTHERVALCCTVKLN